MPHPMNINEELSVIGGVLCFNFLTISCPLPSQGKSLCRNSRKLARSWPATRAGRCPSRLWKTWPAASILTKMAISISMSSWRLSAFSTPLNRLDGSCSPPPPSSSFLLPILLPVLLLLLLLPPATP